MLQISVDRVLAETEIAAKVDHSMSNLKEAVRMGTMRTETKTMKTRSSTTNKNLSSNEEQPDVSPVHKFSALAPVPHTQNPKTTLKLPLQAKIPTVSKKVGPNQKCGPRHAVVSSKLLKRIDSTAPHTQKEPEAEEENGFLQALALAKAWRPGKAPAQAKAPKPRKDARKRSIKTTEPQKYLLGRATTRRSASRLRPNHSGSESRSGNADKAIAKEDEDGSRGCSHQKRIVQVHPFSSKLFNQRERDMSGYEPAQTSSEPTIDPAPISQSLLHVNVVGSDYHQEHLPEASVPFEMGTTRVSGDDDENSFDLDPVFKSGSLWQ